MLLTPSVLLLLGAFCLGVAGTWWVSRRVRRLGRWGRWGGWGREDRIVTQTIAERVRAVGKLIGLEVCAKEIATATTGWAWLPPLLLSQARLAMIFHFEKRYGVDLSDVRAAQVRRARDGSYQVTLPPVEGALRLIDVIPYDIQNARVLGLLDVVPMTADRQKALMARAQHQAAEFLTTNDARYAAEARASIERQLVSLLSLFGVRVRFEWREEPAADAAPAEPAVSRPAPALAVA